MMDTASRIKIPIAIHLYYANLSPPNVSVGITPPPYELVV